MSDSLTVRTCHEVEIDIEHLTRRVGDVLRLLLNQGENFSPKFKIVRTGNNPAIEISTITISDDMFSFFEMEYLNRGSCFFYNMDQYWNLYSSKPVFQFFITEIKRNFSSMTLVFCIAIAISVAEMFSTPEIIDGYGVWVIGKDEVPIDRLLSLALEERLPLEDAVKAFYKRIPISMKDSKGKE